MQQFDNPRFPRYRPPEPIAPAPSSGYDASRASSSDAAVMDPAETWHPSTDVVGPDEPGARYYVPQHERVPPVPPVPRQLNQGPARQVWPQLQTGPAPYLYQLGFECHAVQVDNYSNQWLYFDAARRYVAPYITGQILVMPQGSQVAQYELLAPPGQVQPAVVAAHQVFTYWTEAMLPPTTGVPIPALAASNGATLANMPGQPPLTALAIWDPNNLAYTPIFSPSQGDAVGATRLASIGPYLFNGASYDRQRTPVVFTDVAAVAVTAGTPATLWTPQAGKKFRLMGWLLSVSAGSGVIFYDNASLLFRTGNYLATATANPSPPSIGNGRLSAVANNPLKADVTTSCTLSGVVFGTEE